MSRLSITDVRKETGISGASTECYLRYLKELSNLPSEAIKKAHDKLKPSL